MGLIQGEDLARVAAAYAAVRDDNAVSVALRRGGVPLPAQLVRIAGRAGAGQWTDGGGLQAAVGQVVVLGDAGLDIQPGDRFTVADALYEVISLAPNRGAATIAEARIVQ